MGRVFLGELVTDRPYAVRGTRVAVKVIHPALVDDERLVRRFEREAALGVSVRHPSVIRTFESGLEETATGSQNYLVLEYVEGRTLRNLMTELGTVPETLLRAVALQVAEGLRAIHAVGAVHRDLKPENILITPTHQVKVMDLGIAQVLGEGTRLTQTGAAIGTLLYASPEQVSGEAVDGRADLYSLGVILYEAASGVQPFSANASATIVLRQLSLVPPKLGSLDSRITAFVEEVVACLLEKEPARRFSTAADLAGVLRDGESSDWWRTRSLTSDAQRLRNPLRHLVATDDMPFVGRMSELATLRHALEKAEAGKGQSVLIEGEAGVGKTRLIAELSGDDAIVLYGRCSSVADGYAALTLAVVDHFGAAAVERKLSALLSAPPALIASFAALVSGGTPPSGTQRLSDETVASLMCELARALAASRVLVWVVDDLHLASPEVRRLMRALGQQLTDIRALFVGATRLDSAAESPTTFWPRGAARISLGGLAEADVIALVATQVSRPLLAQELGAALAAQCDGNPFFVVETLRELNDAGELQSLEKDTRASTASRRVVRVARSVREMLIARLRGLSDQERVLLDVAAVQGAEFDPDLTARSLKLARLAVLQTLAGLERKSALVRSQGSVFRFDHRELQRVIYESMPEPLRVEYHGLLAESYGDRLAADGRATPRGAHATFLAEHLLKGKRYDEAEQWVIPGLAHLAQQYGRMVQLLELADLALLALSERGQATQCELQLLRAQAFRHLGDFVQQREAATRALDAANEVRDVTRRARAALALGHSLAALGDLGAARTVFSTARTDAQAAGDRAVEADALAAVGALQLALGDMQRARDVAEQQIAIARFLGDDSRECHGFTILSAALLGMGRAKECGQSCEQQLALSMKTAHRESEVNARYGIAMAQIWRADYEDARRTLATQLEVARGSMQWTVLGHVGFVSLYLDMGQPAAREHLSIALDRAETAGLRHFIGYLRMFAGELAYSAGNFAEAEALYREAVGHARAMGASLLLADAAFRLGRLQFQYGDRDLAVETLVTANAIVDQFGLGSPGALPAAYLALMHKHETPRLDPAVPLRSSLAAEFHLVMHRLSGDLEHLTQAGEILRRMCAQMSAEQARFFWDNFVPARDYHRLVAAA